jgi:hypothetical protein
VGGIPNSEFKIPNSYLRFAMNRKPGLSAGFSVSAWSWLRHFEQIREPHPAADAHGNDAAFGIAALELAQYLDRQNRAGGPERVAGGDGAAVDVGRVGIEAELVDAVDRLAGESFVDLDEVDVVELATPATAQWRT